MRITIAGAAREITDEYAIRLIEQGKAAPAESAPTDARAEKPKGKRPKEVSADEPENAD